MNGSKRTIAIEPTALSDAAMALLNACHLPVADLSSCSGLQLFGAFEGDELRGIIGLEILDRVALLRSLAVTTEYRGGGLGASLVKHVEHQAATRSVDSLYLLTTTAANFFSRLGYKSAARDAAPKAIRETAQFSGLCPASSAFMVKYLPG